MEHPSQGGEVWMYLHGPNLRLQPLAGKNSLAYFGRPANVRQGLPLSLPPSHPPFSPPPLITNKVIQDTASSTFRNIAVSTDKI